jgi:hypothetical protein
MNKTLIGKDNYLFLINDSSNEIINHCTNNIPISLDHLNLYKNTDNFLYIFLVVKSAF